MPARPGRRVGRGPNRRCQAMAATRSNAFLPASKKRNLGDRPANSCRKEDRVPAALLLSKYSGRHRSPTPMGHSAILSFFYINFDLSFLTGEPGATMRMAAS